VNRAAIVMACVSAAAATGSAIIVSRPAGSEQAVYVKRIAGTMLGAGAMILALFAWGLERAAG
jgi:hypothetical protein